MPKPNTTVIKGQCGICGGHNVTDLSHGRPDWRTGKITPRIVCHDRKCKAQFDKRWYTWEEWEKYINSEIEGM